MRIYVYSWVVTCQRPFAVSAYGMDECGRHVERTVHGYMPCYYVRTRAEADAAGANRVTRVRMESSDDLRTGVREERFMLEFDGWQDGYRPHAIMSEFDPLTVFLARTNYPIVGWFDATDDGRLTPCADDPPVPPPTPVVLAFDIECRPHNAVRMPVATDRRDPIVMISVVVDRVGLPRTRRLLYVTESDADASTMAGLPFETTAYGTELAMLDGFGQIVREVDPHVITGYNIGGYDIRVMLAKCRLAMRPMPDLSRDGTGVRVHDVEWHSSAYGTNRHVRLSCRGRVVIDTYLHVRRDPVPLPSYTLDDVAAHHLGRSKSTDVTHEDFWRDRERYLGRYAEYCVRDSELAIDLFAALKTWPNMLELANASRTGLEEIYSRGEQYRVNNIAVKACLDDNILLVRRRNPEPTRSYEGGYVLNPGAGVYPDVATVDFSSMYPSIIIAWNMCPSVRTGVDAETRIATFGDRVGILPRIVRSLIERRNAVKLAMRGAAARADDRTRDLLNSRQMALKITANAVYGGSATEANSYFWDPVCAEAVTARGRLLLRRVEQELVGIIHRHVPDAGATVVYGDTDSCMVSFANGGSPDEIVALVKRACDDFNATLPPPVTLAFERFARRFVMFGKQKCYASFGPDGGADGGAPRLVGLAARRRTYSAYARRCSTELVGMLAPEHGDPVPGVLEPILRDRLRALACDEVPTADLVRTVSVKPASAYKTDTTVPHALIAERIEAQGGYRPDRLKYLYVVTQPPKMRKKPLLGACGYTPDEVRKFGYHVDLQLYMDELASVASEVFGVWTGDLRQQAKTILQRAMYDASAAAHAAARAARAPGALALVDGRLVASGPGRDFPKPPGDPIRRTRDRGAIVDVAGRGAIASEDDDDEL